MLTTRKTIMDDTSTELRLNRHEALVLYEWLASRDDREAGGDRAAAHVLREVEERLEESLKAPMRHDYGLLLDGARREVLRGE